VTTVASGVVLRLLFAATIVAACFALYALLRAAVLSKAGRVARAGGLLTPGKPGIVFFTSPDCAACKAVQRPALRELERKLNGSIEVVEIDTTERPDLARSWSVLSVPTTFILNRDGRPVHVNHGAASARKLQGQLQAAL
jgi:thiol-disulfide isomerase/thioredoxin